MDTVKFTQMADGDRADYELLDSHERQSALGVGDRLLAALSALDNAPSAYRVSRMEHSIQAATRAWRDGADTDWVVTTLFHDLGDFYAPYNHDEYAAAILRPYVREQCVWVVSHHGLFQRYYYAHHFGGDRDARVKHRDSPYFDDAVEFCARWDQASFDPNYRSLPMTHFRAMIDEVFAREPYAACTVLPGVRLPLRNANVAKVRLEQDDAA